MLVKIPELDNDNVRVSQSIFEVTGDKALEIYKTMKDELKEVKIEEWRKVMAEEKNAPKVIFTARLTSNYGAYVNVEMPLTEKLTPKAYALFEKQLDRSKIKVNFEKFITALASTQYPIARKVELKINYYIYESEYIQYEYSARDYNYNFNKYNDHIRVLNVYQNNTPVQSDTSYAEIEFKVYDKNIKNETPFIYNFVINLDGIENYNLPAGTRKVE